MGIIQLIRIPFHRFIARSVPIVTRQPMSFKIAVAKLKLPIQDLVLSVTRDGHEFLGENEADANDVLEWIDKMSHEGFLTESGLKVCLHDLLYNISSQFLLVMIVRILIVCSSPRHILQPII